MAATKLLANMLKKLNSEPVEGFVAELIDESNLFEWRIWIEGPKETPYEEGVFQLEMKFPPDYPMSPPELKFMSDFWHPNVYKDTGMVCISILHPPVEDEMSGELPEERWLPTQSVSTILLSVISLLNAPNFSSAANVDASVEWRNNPEVYKARCKRLVDKANQEKPSYVVIPHPESNPEEKAKQVQKLKELEKPIETDDFMLEPDNIEEDEDEEEESHSQSSKEEKKPKTKKKKNKQTKKKKIVVNNNIKINKKSSKEETEEKEEDIKTTRKKKKCVIM